MAVQPNSFGGKAININHWSDGFDKGIDVILDCFFSLSASFKPSNSKNSINLLLSASFLKVVHQNIVLERDINQQNL
ncbi:hypothetical protein ACT691_16600 [Vibrio metschnikovii]